MRLASPKVSIVIPVYNGANYLHEAICSALAQTYPNIEILVVNDGSEDEGETERIALSYGDRIRYIWKENGGVATALNVGIDHMTGEYFSWLSHDDMYTPEKIATQLAKLEEMEEQAVVVSNYSVISPYGKLLYTSDIPEFETRELRARLSLQYGFSLHGCTFLVPRVFFDQHGRFNPALRYTQDLDMWFRLASSVPFIRVEESLVRSRYHEEQDSQSKKAAFWAESDSVMSGLLNQVSDREIAQICERSFDTCLSIYDSKKMHGFDKVGRYLLRHLYLLADTPGKKARAIALIEKHVGPMLQEEPFLDLLVNTFLVPKTKPRMLVYLDVWIVGGVQRVMKVIIESLLDQYEWILVYTDALEVNGFSLSHQIRIIHLKLEGEVDLASRLAALSQLLQADIFIGCATYQKELLPIYEMLDGTGIRSMACNFGHYFLPYHIEGLHPTIGLRRQMYPKATVVTWLTNYSARLYAEQHANVATIPTPNSFEKALLRAEQEKKIIVAVGRLYDPVKRLDRMLEVFAEVLKKHPDAELLLVGPYSLNMVISKNETIAQLIYRLGIPSDRYRFMGEKAQVKPYYLKASLLMLTSDSEGIPMVLNEAGNFGLPCVVQEIAGLEDMIIDGENGYIVPQGDTIGMANKISLLLSDRDLRKRMGSRAIDLVERFSKERISSRWESLIDTLLSTKSKTELEEKLANHFMNPVLDRDGFNRRMSREYEHAITAMLTKRDTGGLPGPRAISLPIGEREAVFAEAYTKAMVEYANTFSWKVTRPLRWAKLLAVSLRNDGLRVTGRKVVNRIRVRLKR